jgi:S-adenosylmethionine synthetase
VSNRSEFIFTSESVSEGHPDKVCDRISDAVLDAFLTEEPESRVACETFATTDRVVVGGEVRASDEVLAGLKDRVEQIVRDCVHDIGYAQKGFHWATLNVDNYLHGQSNDIAQGVDAAEGKDEGAGDQGIMFGYATDETEAMMPAPIHYAHAVLRRLSEVRKSGQEPRLGPDAKSQITLRYADGKPVEVASLVLSTQHLDEDMTSDDVREMVEPHIRAVLPGEWITKNTVWHVNPTGKFCIGGPDGDAGLTGRKIIVDTYGGAAPHGGGAFSARTLPRLIAQPLMSAAISQRTWSRPASRNAAPSKSATPSALQCRRAFMSISTAPTRLLRQSSKPSCRR